MESNESKRTVVLGSIGSSRMGGVGSIGSLASVAQEVKRVELQKRNLLLAEHSLMHKDNNVLEQIYRLTPKQLKSKSKEFNNIYRYLEPLQLRTFHGLKRFPAKGELTRMVKTINALVRSKPFMKVDFEDSTTDFFELTMAAVCVLQDIVQKYDTMPNKDLQLRLHLALMASDLKERLYSMYVDNRMESAMEDENVIMR